MSRSNILNSLKNKKNVHSLKKKPMKKKKIIHYDQYMILYWKADRSESLTKFIDVPENHPGFEWKCNHDIAREMFLQLNPNVDPNLILSVSYCWRGNFMKLNDFIIKLLPLFTTKK